MAKTKKKTSISRKPAVTGTGVLSAAAGGFAFIRDDNSDQEFFCPKKHVGHAIDGDHVAFSEVREKNNPGPSLRHDHTCMVVKVTAVLERGREFIVGRLDKPHSLTPMNKHLPESIRLNNVPRNAKRGDWVRARLLADGPKHTETLHAEVDKVIGASGTVEHDIDAIVAEYGLLPPYTDAENNAAAKLVPMQLEREDLTGMYTVTIDPADAHDFDDAISIMPGNKKTEVLLGVHIADVAAWIHPNTKFDKAAAKRGFSAYLPGRFLPMLPKQLTEKISMREGVASPAHSIIFTVRKRDGKILGSRRVHSTVRVNRRLDFDSLQNYFDTEKIPENWDKDTAAHVDLLRDVVMKMSKLRAKEEQFLRIDTKEISILCNEQTYEITGVLCREQNTADRIVEECMLAANSAVAEELINSNLAGLFRIHPDPDPQRLEEFSAFVYELYGFHTGDLTGGRAACQAFLEKIPDDARKSITLSRFLRAMARAVYSENKGFHFGLGKSLYSHFTSPIRRYPDLVLHQQLLAMDMKKRLRSKKTFQKIAVDCTKWEEQTDNAYYAVNDRLKLHWLKNSGALETSPMYEAVIQKVTTSGLLCEIIDLGMLGFVPSERMRGGGYHYAGSRNHVRSGRGHGEYKVGDFIYLALDTIDLVRGTAQFRCLM